MKLENILLIGLLFFACQKTDLNSSSGNQDSVSALPQQPLRIFAGIYSGRPPPGFNLNKANDSTSLVSIERKLRYLCDSDTATLPGIRPHSLSSYYGFFASTYPEDTTWPATDVSWKCQWGTVQIYHVNPPAVCMDRMKNHDSDLYLPDSSFEVEKELTKIGWERGAIPDVLHKYIDSVINANATGN